MATFTNIAAAAAAGAGFRAQFPMTDRTIKGRLVRYVCGSAFYATPVSSTGAGAAVWNVERDGAGIVCQLRRAEVAVWLHRMARTEATELELANAKPAAAPRPRKAKPAPPAPPAQLSLF